MREDLYLRNVKLSDLAVDTPDAFADGPFGSNLKSDEYTNEGVRLIQLQNIGVGEWLDSNKKYISTAKLASLARHETLPGDIAIAKMADPVARACIVPPVARRFIVVADCIKLRIDHAKADPRFVTSLLNSYSVRIQAEQKSIGTTRIRINLSTLKNLAVAIPALEAQKKIADILDAVDDAIQSTERLIAKLEQTRQGLLHDLLIHRGRTSSIGLTPKPWPIVHLRELYVERPRNGLYKPPRFHGAGAPMVQMGQLFRGPSLDAGDAPRVQVSATELERFGLACGDLLFGRRSLVLEGAGKCAVVDRLAEPMTFESSLIRVRIDSSRLNPSLAALILSMPEAACDRMRYVRQVAVSGVTSDDVGNFTVPVPPIDEQRRIEEVLQTQQSRIAVAREESAKLRLLKRGLMDDLLTGRVWVPTREAALG